MIWYGQGLEERWPRVIRVRLSKFLISLWSKLELVHKGALVWMWFTASKAILEPERRSSMCQGDCSHSSSTGSSEQLQAQRQPAGGSLQQEINPGHLEEPRSFQLELNWLRGGQKGIQMLILYENGTLSKDLRTCVSFFFIEPWKWNLKQQYTWGNTWLLPTMGLECDSLPWGELWGGEFYREMNFYLKR